MDATKIDLATLTRRLAESRSARVDYLEDGAWRQVSGAELALRLERVRGQLRGWGVGRGSRVGVHAPNSLAWLSHDLALLDLGAISVAIPDEVDLTPQQIAERYDLHLLLLSRERVAALGAERPPWVASLDRSGDEGATSRAAPPSTLPDDVFTFALSSGATGALKTLLVSRTGLAAAMDHFIRAYDIVETDSIVVFLPLSNLQQREIAFGALWLGLQVILVSPQNLFRALKERRPTLFIGPPVFYESIYRRFLGATNPWQRWLATLASGLALALPGPVRVHLLRRVYAPIHEALGGRMRLMITGMAHIQLATLKFFSRVGIELFEAYGLTECGLVAGNARGRNRIGSVGLPFEAGSVQIAADGEVMVRLARRIATGYWRQDPEEERRVFVDARTVATGDLGRFDEDGYLYIVGRKKEAIVTAGGAKFQPEELERRIKECRGVEQCAVVPAQGVDAVGLVVRLTPDAGTVERAEIARQVVAINRTQPRGADIRRTVWADAPFTVENGMLTRNLKLNRARISEHFRASIASSAAESARQS